MSDNIGEGLVGFKAQVPDLGPRRDREIEGHGSAAR